MKSKIKNFSISVVGNGYALYTNVFNSNPSLTQFEEIFVFESFDALGDWLLENVDHPKEKEAS